MSADRLREAARVLRERAEAATPGPWSAANEHGLLGQDAWPAWCVSQMRPGFESMSDVEGYITDVADVHGDDRDENANAAYIATIHPGVGLALADWLDATTCGLHCGDDGMRFPYCSACEDSTYDHECPKREPCKHTGPMRAALRVAELILGSAP